MAPYLKDWYHWPNYKLIDLTYFLSFRKKTFRNDTSQAERRRRVRSEEGKSEIKKDRVKYATWIASSQIIVWALIFGHLPQQNSELAQNKYVYQLCWLDSLDWAGEEQIEIWLELAHGIRNYSGGGHINIQQQTYQFVLSQDSPEYSQLENTEQDRTYILLRSYALSFQ